jgi:hypothetical protein
VGVGDLQEDVSRATQQQKISLTLQEILGGRLESLFYVPSTEEVMNLENKGYVSDQSGGESSIEYNEMVNERTLEQSLRDLVKPISLLKKATVIEETPGFTREVHFTQATKHTSQSFKLLAYLKQVANIFQLEYFMGKTNAPGVEVLENECHTYSGRNYWDKARQVAMTAGEDGETVSERIINKIVAKKKARVDLAEDLKQVAAKLQAIETRISSGLGTDKRLEKAMELLSK